LALLRSNQLAIDLMYIRKMRAVQSALFYAFFGVPNG